MTLQALKDKDRELTKIERGCAKRLQTAIQLVHQARLDFFRQAIGLEVGCLVVLESSYAPNNGGLYVVSRIDTSVAPTYGKRRVKPWVWARRVIGGDPNNTVNEETHLMNNWRVYDE